MKNIALPLSALLVAGAILAGLEITEKQSEDAVAVKMLALESGLGKQEADARAEEKASGASAFEVSGSKNRPAESLYIHRVIVSAPAKDATSVETVLAEAFCSPLGEDAAPCIAKHSRWLTQTACDGSLYGEWPSTGWMRKLMVPAVESAGGTALVDPSEKEKPKPCEP